MGERNSFDRVESAECSVFLRVYLVVGMFLYCSNLDHCACLCSFEYFMLCCMFVVIFGMLG